MHVRRRRRVVVGQRGCRIGASFRVGPVEHGGKHEQVQAEHIEESKRAAGLRAQQRSRSVERDFLGGGQLVVLARALRLGKLGKRVGLLLVQGLVAPFHVPQAVFEVPRAQTAAIATAATAASAAAGVTLQVADLFVELQVVALQLLARGLGGGELARVDGPLPLQVVNAAHEPVALSDERRRRRRRRNA